MDNSKNLSKWHPTQFVQMNFNLVKSEYYLDEHEKKSDNNSHQQKSNRVPSMSAKVDQDSRIIPQYYQSIKRKKRTYLYTQPKTRGTRRTQRKNEINRGFAK